MQLSDYCADYVAYLRHEQRAAKTTLTCYQCGLNGFLRWMQANGYDKPSLFDFNANTLRRYLHFLSGQGLRPRTLRGRFHPLRGLGSFLVAHGTLKANPAATIVLPRKDPAIRLTVSEEEVRRLLEACQRIHPPQRAALCHAMLATLIFAGTRRQETLDLKVGDIDTEEGFLLVRHGKGDKPRKIYLPDEAVAAIKEWLCLRPSSALPWLFLLDKGRRVGQDGLANIVEEVKAVAGLAGVPNSNVPCRPSCVPLPLLPRPTRCCVPPLQPSNPIQGSCSVPANPITASRRDTAGTRCGAGMSWVSQAIARSLD